MIKTEKRINLDALAYNLVRLHKIKQEIKKKYNRRLRRFLRKHIHKKTKNNSQQQYSKKITQSPKFHFWWTPLHKKRFLKNLKFIVIK